MSGARRAAFLDRDGTIIEEAHYLADPARVRLVPGAPAALRALAGADYALVIVTNQSGIARGLYSAADFAAVQQRLEELLRAEGIAIDAVFHCPHHPDVTGPCDCRKPQLGMYRQAAARLGLDLAASVYIGDRIKDVLPALATGGRGLLVRTGYGEQEETALPAGVAVAPDLDRAVRSLLAQDARDG
ncbi:MAG TPA: HAD family hydrolase [Longimicrobiales bacterium]|nr:HAD family hydrolase [Longimicrobiales bacterium]